MEYDAKWMLDKLSRLAEECNDRNLRGFVVRQRKELSKLLGEHKPKRRARIVVSGEHLASELGLYDGIQVVGAEWDDIHHSAILHVVGEALPKECAVGEGGISPIVLIVDRNYDEPAQLKVMP